MLNEMWYPESKEPKCILGTNTALATSTLPALLQDASSLPNIESGKEYVRWK